MGTIITKPGSGGGGGGGVTSVTGTTPVVSSGGATPDISMAAATTSVDGYLTSTNFNTFNGKQGAITLTTTGTGGAATLVGATLNIPQYANLNTEIVKFGTGTLTAGQLYYLNSSGVWTLANASAAASSTGMLGIAVGTSPTVDGLLVRGYAVNAGYTQSTGSIIYIATTAGSITETAPSATTQVVRVVGYKTSLTNTIYLNPDPTWVTLA